MDGIRKPIGTLELNHQNPREGFSSRGIRSLGAMGSGSGQDQEFPCRRGRRRRRDGDPQKSSKMQNGN